jgi:hypothetical protein
LQAAMIGSAWRASSSPSSRLAWAAACFTAASDAMSRGYCPMDEPATEKFCTARAVWTP